jgi:hypothetical protein
MPKVNYTNTKGLYQETGSGLNLSDGVLNYRKKVVTVTGDRTMDIQETGAIVLLKAGTSATVITLPGRTTAPTGCSYTFVPVDDNTGGYTIKTDDPGDDEIMYGRISVLSTTKDKTASILADGSSNDTLLLKTGSGSAQTLAGARGSVITVSHTATGNWNVTGHLISLGTAPSSVVGFADA